MPSTFLRRLPGDVIAATFYKCILYRHNGKHCRPDDDQFLIFKCGSYTYLMLEISQFTTTGVLKIFISNLSFPAGRHVLGLCRGRGVAQEQQAVREESIMTETQSL